MGFALLSRQTNIDFAGFRKVAYAISAIFIVVGMIAILFNGGLRYGVDFAGGVMVSVVCCDPVIEAVETNVGVVIVILAIAIGVAVTYLLNYLIDRKTNPEVPHIDENHPKTADDLDELIHSDHLEYHRAESDNKLGLFVAGIPAVGDGQMLFLETAIAKMKPTGSRVAIIHNGSPLFTGDAGSGPSEIRRYLIEQDLVEAIVQLPTDLFYNTGILGMSAVSAKCHK